MTRTLVCSLLLFTSLQSSGHAAGEGKTGAGGNTPAGFVQVDSTPAGARVFLDGRPLGRTPLLRQKVTAGIHELRLEFPDFAEATRQIKVRAGKQAVLKVKLQPLFGGLRVTVPDGIKARVWLDGSDVGPAPVLLQRVLAGPHQVRVVAEKLPPFEKRVTVRPGRQELLAAPLDRYLARLLVTTTPVQGQVVIDGRLRGSTPLRLLLAPGKHRLQVRAGPGTKPLERRLSLSAGRVTRLRLRLPVAYGALRVHIEPRGAIVEIDGRRRGRAPLALKRLSTGLHVIVARVKGLEPMVGRVEVLPGKTARVDMDLRHPERSRFYSGAEETAEATAARAGELPALVAPPPAQAGETSEPAAATAVAVKTPEESAAVGQAAGAEKKNSSAAKTLVARHETSPRPAAEPAATVAASAPGRPMTTWRLLAWVSTGTAGAAVVTMAVLFGMGAKKRSDADAAWDRAIDTSLPRREREDAYRQAQDLDNQADNLFLGGWITTGLAAAAGSAAVLLFLLEPEPDKSGSTAWNFTPLPGGGWVSLAVTF